MGKDKLRKFDENKTFAHVFQPSFFDIKAQGFPLKNQWKNDFFQNSHPLTLELGCGKGEYTIGLATLFPERNFVGVDVKGARIWRGAKTAEERQMKNVAFVRTRIDLIPTFFGSGDQVEEIWITFPDPQPRESREKKRLTSENFLKKYRQFCSPDCKINLKTDSIDLFHYTKTLVEESGLKTWKISEDIDRDFPGDEILGIRTFYEKTWRNQGLKIHYISFSLFPQETKGEKS